MKELKIDTNSRWVNIAKAGGMKLHRRSELDGFDDNGLYVRSEEFESPNVASMCEFRFRVFLGLLSYLIFSCIALGGLFVAVVGPGMIALRHLAGSFLETAHWFWVSFAVVGAGALVWAAVAFIGFLLWLAKTSIARNRQKRAAEKQAARAAAEAEATANGAEIAKSMWESWKDKVCTRVKFTNVKTSEE